MVCLWFCRVCEVPSLRFRRYGPFIDSLLPKVPPRVRAIWRLVCFCSIWKGMSCSCPRIQEVRWVVSWQSLHHWPSFWRHGALPIADKAWKCGWLSQTLPLLLPCTVPSSLLIPPIAPSTPSPSSTDSTFHVQSSHRWYGLSWCLWLPARFGFVFSRHLLTTCLLPRFRPSLGCSDPLQLETS